MYNCIQDIIESHIFLVKKIYNSKEIIDNISVATINIIKSIKNGGKIILCGNGGSASDCQHIAAEFIGRFEKDRSPIPAISLTVDTSIITAISNDYGYDYVFSRQLLGIGNKKDVLIGISTSGNSINVINAVIEAKKMGISTITLTGNEGGSIKNISDININITSSNTARIQEIHILIGHIFCNVIENNI